MKLTKKLGLMVFTAMLGASTSAFAGGFYIQEQSVSGQGQAFAGAQADARDASILFNNPAAMTELSGAQITIGTSVLIPSSKFQNNGSTTTVPVAVPLTGGDDSNPFSATPVPNIYAVTPLANDRYWLGVSVTAPFGLSNDYGSSWVGRYDSTKTRLSTLDISPQFAMKVTPKLSVAAGPDFQRASGTLETAIPLAIPGSPATDGSSRLKGDSWAVGFNAGLLYKFNDQTQAGLHYRSAINQGLNGRLNISGLPVPPSVAASADLKLPDIVEFGVSHKLNSQWTLLGSANWYNWSKFKGLAVVSPLGTSTTEFNYKDSYSFAAGTSYKYSDAWTFRGGVQFDKTPTETDFRSSRAPDSNRFWLSLGTTYNINKHFSLDGAATHIFMPDSDVNVTDTAPSGIVTNLHGTTKNSVDILSIAGTYHF
ncbi:MAG: outer membrane protein transport protein [Micavibrio sp.]|nr:outer membrane protein transport protein [Micavibrio sp.]